MIPVAPSASFWDQMTMQAAAFAIDTARINLSFLVAAFGPTSEPDYGSVAPVYSRMLAIALLLLGGIVAFALIERILGGPKGAGWSTIASVVAGTFFAYSGLAIVQYVGGYAALLATAWSPDLANLSTRLAAASNTIPPHASWLGLLFTALLLTLMCLLVYLELVVRAALILVVTSFIPLVSVLAIWPRMAGAATHLAEFLLGLLLSKFVVATALYVGLRLTIPALIGQSHGDWMASGIAVLLIAAFSPIVIFQAFKFAHATSANVVRDLGAGALSMAPTRAVTGLGKAALARVPTKTASNGVRDTVDALLRKKS